MPGTRERQLTSTSAVVVKMEVIGWDMTDRNKTDQGQPIKYNETRRSLPPMEMPRTSCAMNQVHTNPKREPFDDRYLFGFCAFLKLNSELLRLNSAISICVLRATKVWPLGLFVSIHVPLHPLVLISSFYRWCFDTGTQFQRIFSLL